MHKIYSIAENPGEGSLPLALQEELMKRWQDHVDHPEQAITWEIVQDEALARLEIITSENHSNHG